MRFVDFYTLKGKTLSNIEVSKNENVIYFTVSENEKYKMFHEQDCCESVTIEDICGELNWLLNTPILLAEERSNSEENKNDCDSCTWTFYELATINGSVTIRWFGESNGYYSERVDFELLRQKKEMK